jgi:iron complex outermembrane recepter protein
MINLPSQRTPGRSGTAFTTIALWLLSLVAAMNCIAQGVDGATASAPDSAPATVSLPPVNVIGASPLIGSGIDRDTVPAQTHVLTSRDLTRDGTPNAVGALNQQLGGVTLDSASGNQFQPTFFYHGFQASPLQGTPQGIAVYMNGMRFNQPFGDTVDWDLIPDIAINRIDVVGANPVFGLNALGGALNVMLKSGFDYQGFEADLSGGSFRQVQGEFQYGVRDGNTSLYVAGNALHQDGWRDLQTSALQNFYGDAGWRGQRAEVHANVNFAHSILNGPGTSPVELLAADRRAQFTAPNQISNNYVATSVNGTFDISETASLQGIAYYRYFHQTVVNGNAPADAPCADGSGLMCSDSGVSTTTGGVPIPDFLDGGPYSELDTQSTNTNAYGVAAQYTNTDRLFGLRNHFVTGLSFDGAHNGFGAISYLGGLSSPGRAFVGPGVVIDEPGSNSPVSANIANSTYGVYFADTLTLNPDAALTLSGRYNAARVRLSDQNGGDLSGNHNYDHFNPALGMTYRVTPWMTAYGGYAVTNRAPTPAELSCAGPENSCSLANFFVGDPDLQQVIAHTVEAGVRGTFALAAGASLTYGLAYFHTDLDNDIAFINSDTQGRAFFANIGQTRRQGIDASLEFDSDRWHAYFAYSHIDASYQTTFTEASGDNPAADPDGNVTVNRGNKLPGIPANQVKFGAYFKVTPGWTIGGVGIAASNAYLFGDEANLTPKLPGYFTLNLSTTYQVNKNVQVFAWANNITNTRYYTFGTFAPTSSVYLVEAPNATDPRSYSPAAPASVFGGVRITF